ncbi:hypothetical protein BOTNAR_0098g00060 [Botryotinia narcissicola]|uniref:Copper transporter n=1 Tax=Botryotinia narcissicola TaxID=278944 RepID=A0A4Z1ISH1_9HELO|nr:hypothetical protein BOTNAR_0098g00060 [Botryotinia narcissicola]
MAIEWSNWLAFVGTLTAHYILCHQKLVQKEHLDASRKVAKSRASRAGASNSGFKGRLIDVHFTIPLQDSTARYKSSKTMRISSCPNDKSAYPTNKMNNEVFYISSV